MKVNYMALIMSGLFSSGLWAAANNHPTDIEKRLAQLEQRVVKIARLLSRRQEQTLQDLAQRVRLAWFRLEHGAKGYHLKIPPAQSCPLRVRFPAGDALSADCRR